MGGATWREGWDLMAKAFGVGGKVFLHPLPADRPNAGYLSAMAAGIPPSKFTLGSDLYGSAGLGAPVFWWTPEWWSVTVSTGYTLTK
jgi:hypothetical protein